MGRVDYEQMLDELTPQQFERWLAYDQVEPIGFEKLYQVIALVGAAICNAWEMEVEPGDFIPGYEPPEPEEPETNHAAIAVLQQIAARQNASILGG